MPRVGIGRIYQPGVHKGEEPHPDKVWWVDYSYHGQRFRECSGSPKRSIATRLLKQRLAECQAGTFAGPDADRMLLNDLLAGVRSHYTMNARKSLPRLDASIRHLLAYFGEWCRAVNVTTDRITAYTSARLDEGAAPATVQQELAHLKRAFNLAVKARLLPSRPHIESLHFENARQGFFEVDDLERLLPELDPDVQPVVRFAALTGWRFQEVISLTWPQVDFQAGEVRLWTSKNEEPRVFPFNVLPPLAALLQQQRERTREVERKTGQVIQSVFHRGGKPITSIRAGWQTACQRAGVSGRIFHDLRRTAVRNLERAGVPRSVAMKLTGHKTESVYRRYAIVDSRSLQEGVQKLARMFEEPRTVLPIRAARG